MFARNFSAKEIDIMALRPGSKTLLKASVPEEPAEQSQPADQEDQRPRNTPPNTVPVEGFSIEVDGKLKSQHATEAAALKIGAELKRKFPVLQVKIYDAVAKTRSLVEAAK